MKIIQKYQNIILIFFLLFLFFYSLKVGRIQIDIKTIFSILLNNFIDFKSDYQELEEKIVELVRLPRVLMALVIGAGLAVAGASLQSIFRNPLAGPEILGVSSGAAFGGSLAILLFDKAVMIISLAFIFGFLSILLISFLSRINGQNPVLMVVLSGVVIGALFSALTSLLTFIADPEDKLPAIVYWLLGSLAGADFNKLLIVSIPTILGIILIYLLRYRLNLLSLGEEEAKSLGIDIERTKWLILATITLIISSCVAICGIIGWVGLIIPHFARMLVGANHKRLIPVSIFIGSSYLLVIDNFARTLGQSEIPLSILTAIIGAPIFIYLLRKMQNKGWNNA
jgi:iron complex transport system permease protein